MAEGILPRFNPFMSDSVLKDISSLMVTRQSVKDNPLNDNFARAESECHRKQINHKYAYTVEFDSNELIRKSIDHINEKYLLQNCNIPQRRHADRKQKWMNMRLVVVILL
ncbi:MAG: hypothetical protein ACLTBV_19530 [Enterocloster bolteae]